VGTERFVGTIVGADPQNDLALVRVSRPLAGRVLALSAQDPPVGSRVAAIGFPEGQPVTLTQGGVSGLDRTVAVQGRTRSGLLQTDAAVNPGNSGGPLLDLSGRVVGLVDAVDTEARGIAYAVPATVAAREFPGWEAAPDTQTPTSCADPLGPSAESDPGLTADPSGPLGALETYFKSINDGDYAAAYAVLGPTEQAEMSLQEFSADTSTSFDTDFTVGGVAAGANGTVVSLTFTSVQAAAQGPSGDTCDVWTLDYSMRQDSTGAWRIDTASARNGSTHSPC
jgi:hypothetical protein